MIDRFLRRLSVRSRVVGGFLILIVLLALSAPLSVANYTFLVERLRQVTNIEAGADRALLLASTRIASSRVNLMRYIDNQVPSPSEALDDTGAAARLLTDALDQNLITAPDQIEAVTAVVKALADYRALITDIEAARQKEPGQDIARVVFQAYRLGNDSGQRIEQIVKDSAGRVAAANASVETDAQGRLWLLIASYVGVSILGLILTLLIQRSITQPVAKLRGAAEAFRQGRMDTVIAVTGTDELSLLAQTFNQMTAQLSKLYLDLERRVEARTAQLQASAEVGRAAASILDTDELLRTIVNLIADRFGFYYAAVFTLADSQQWAELREATGEAGRVLKERQHRLEAGGQSMVGTAIATRRARIALDTGAEAVRFANPLLPDTRSEIALPLVVGNRVLGALDVQSAQAAAFDETNAAVLQTMADQIAIALSNAEQFKQTEVTLTNTRNLFAASQEMSTATDTDDLLRTLIGHITSDASRAGITLFGPRDETGQPAYYEFVATWVHANYAAIMQPIRPGARFTSQQLPVVSAVTPAQPLVVPDANADEVPPALRMLMHRFGAEALIALALNAGQNPLGILIVGYRQARTFSADYLQTLVTLSNQAAIVIQNQRSLAETQAALKQLDLVNRRLTGEAWQAYTAPLGGALTIRDVAPGAQGESTPAALNAPIVVRGEPIGALKLQDVNPDRTWSASDRTLLEAVANEIAVAIDNARLLEQTERRAQREQLISEISRKMLAASNMQSIIQIAGDELSRALQVSRAAVKIGVEAEEAISTANAPDSRDADQEAAAWAS